MVSDSLCVVRFLLSLRLLFCSTLSSRLYPHTHNARMLLAAAPKPHPLLPSLSLSMVVTSHYYLRSLFPLSAYVQPPLSPTPLLLAQCGPSSSWLARQTECAQPPRPLSPAGLAMCSPVDFACFVWAVGVKREEEATQPSYGCVWLCGSMCGWWCESRGGGGDATQPSLRNTTIMK